MSLIAADCLRWYGLAAELLLDLSFAVGESSVSLGGGVWMVDLALLAKL